MMEMWKPFSFKTPVPFSCMWVECFEENISLSFLWVPSFLIAITMMAVSIRAFFANWVRLNTANFLPRPTVSGNNNCEYYHITMQWWSMHFYEFWLVRLSRNILCYIFTVLSKQLGSRFPSFTEENIHVINKATWCTNTKKLHNLTSRCF